MTISLHFSPSHLRLLVGSGNRDSVKINRFLEVALPEGVMINGIITNPEGLTRFLTDVAQQNGPFEQDTVVTIDNNSVRSKVMNLPAVKDKQLAQFVKEEMGSYSDTESDTEDIVDYRILGPNKTGSGNDVLGVTVGKPILESFRSSLTQAGFNLKTIDVNINVINKVALLMPEMAQGATLFVILDGQTLTQPFFVDGVFQLSKKYRLIAPANSSEQRTELGNNISQMLQFQKAQRTADTVNAIYVAGLDTEGILGLISEAFYIDAPIVEFDIANRVRLNDKAAFTAADFQLSKYLLAIGALIRR